MANGHQAGGNDGHCARAEFAIADTNAIAQTMVQISQTSISSRLEQARDESNEVLDSESSIRPMRSRRGRLNRVVPWVRNAIASQWRVDGC